MVIALDKFSGLTRIATVEEVEGRLSQETLGIYSRGVSLFNQGKYQAALEAFEQTLRHKKEFPLALYNRGVVLVLLYRFQEALGAFEQVFEFRGRLPDKGVKLYGIWATAHLANAFDGLLTQDLRAFEQGGLKYIDILEKAQQDGPDKVGVVEDALAQFKARLKKRKEQKAFEELEVFIRLMKIKDPFDAARALAIELSRVWPKGVTAEEAIREQRR